MKAQSPRIALQGSEGLLLIRESDIIYALAAGNYTEVHLKGNRMIKILRKLKEVGALLPSDHFIRIHRSHLINIEYAIQFDHNAAKVTLSSGTILPIAQNRKNNFLKRFTRI